jgi:hypothetical protein
MKKTLVAVASSLTLVACGPSRCVARATLVSTPRGPRRIEELHAQESVWCVDPLSGERVASAIVAIERAKREVMRLDGDGFSLRCTTDHPIYDPVAQRWAPAGDWALGHRSEILFIQDEDAPRVVQVSSCVVSDGLDEVIDLTVEHALHNFIAAGVLVHNKSIRSFCFDERGEAPFPGDQCPLPDGGTGIVRCEPRPDGGYIKDAFCDP